MAIQLLPIPIGAYSIWGYANEALGRQAWGHISVDLGMTIFALVFYLANISLIVVSLFVAKDRRGAELLLSVLTWVTAATTIALLISKSGLVPALEAGGLSDALCAISALGILLALASTVRAIEQHASHNDERTEFEGTRHLALLASGLALAIGIAGIGFGGTFNNFLVTGFGIVIFASIQVVRRAGLPNWAALMLVTTMLLAAAMIVIWRYDSTRAVAPLLQFATAASADAISLTQRLLSDTGWWGTGAGTFTSLLPIYQDLSSSVTKPPSTASVLAIELGWPMLIVVIATAAWLITTLYRGALSRGRDSLYPAVGAACSVVILGQAFCDASLLNSCIAVIGAAVIGLGLAQRVTRRSDS
jgi:hypothetical protein